jgi:hypothetical protein
MKYNLTQLQKNALTWIVAQVRAGKIGESFSVEHDDENSVTIDSSLEHILNVEWLKHVSFGQLEALAAAGFLHCKPIKMTYKGGSYERGKSCTLTGTTFKAVEENFAEPAEPTPISALAHPHPLEIAIALDRFRAKFPDPKKVGFLIMRFSASKPFAGIVEVIKRLGEQNGLTIIRADENEFHSDLWGNVRTHLHGCGFGIAIFERIETNEPNANVGLEVGYLLAMGKPVLLLKDKTVPVLQADLAGKLYKPFDPHDPEGTVPKNMLQWLEDYGIILPSTSGKS